MAKKSRTPAPPRRPVQAPRARTGARAPRESRVWLVAIVVAALGFVGLGVVGAVFLLSGSSTSAAAAFQDVGGTVEIFPASRSGLHVTKPPKQSEYNSFPPTNGPHHPVPAPFDVYDEPVEQYRLVHNLEHGGVAIQYGKDVPEEAVNQVLEWYRDDPNGIVIAPLPELGRTIALTAWTSEDVRPGESPRGGMGVLAKSTVFDKKAFDAFMDDYAFQGPERFPKEALAPGS
jgi:hypothetical protein